MADLGKNLKNILVKSMEAIGNTASNIASNTKYKVDEMNLLNRKREILNDFGAKAYAIWEKSENVNFPEELRKDLEELCRIDNLLVDMRAEHYSGLDADTSAGQESTVKEAKAPAQDAADHPSPDAVSPECSQENAESCTQQDDNTDHPDLTDHSSESVAETISSLFEAAVTSDVSNDDGDASAAQPENTQL